MPFWITLALFTLTYVFLAVGRVPGLRMDRAGIALVGATAMLLAGQLSFDVAFSPAVIDYRSLVLLFGLMVVVGVLRLVGVFERLTAWWLRGVASPHALLAVTIGLSGTLSAFLVNDVVCLAFTPLLLAQCRRLGLDPVPHLIGLAMAANLGSAGAITGNPQNMYIGTSSGISYLRFTARLMPVAVLGMVVAYFLIAWVYRRRLAAPLAPVPEEASTATPAPLPPLPHGEGEADRVSVPRFGGERSKAVAVTLATIVAFFVVPSEHLPLVALTAAAVCFVGRVPPVKIYQQIDWPLLVLFAGLFILVGAFRRNVLPVWGVTEWAWLRDDPVGALSLVSAGLSNVVSNVPAVMLFRDVIEAMPATARETAWLALAMSSTFAGNLTVLGSVANLIVVEAARRDGVEVSFVEHLKVGVPLTVLTLALGILWLTWVRY